MGGFFGVVAKSDCVRNLFYGTDYHSHLGTVRGGLAVRNENGFQRHIHDITNAQFRSKFDDDIDSMHGNKGIGVISDYDDQPLIIGSHLGVYGIVTVGVIQNIAALSRQAFRQGTHFSEMSGTEINPTELVATLINQAGSFEEGIRCAQEAIEGSCSILILTDEGIYAARDRLGRTPVTIGKGPTGFAATMETCAFPNLGYDIYSYLGPGEIVFFNDVAVEQRRAPDDKMQICAFLWVYYGYPASCYEGINTESVRYRCGQALARSEDAAVDVVAGIPDSGTAHGLGYANEANLPFRRPFVKYTPTWPRSFMPQSQAVRELVANMKLIPVREIIEDQRILFCDDSIVRGTQLKDNARRMFDSGAREVHIRSACPPLLYPCKFLNFSRSRSEMDLAARRTASKLEDGNCENCLAEYGTPGSDRQCAMVEKIRQRLGVTSLRYQKLDDLVKAIGLPKEKLCTYCWDGTE